MTDDLRHRVRERYAAAANDASCCEPGCGTRATDPGFGAALYRSEDVVAVPEGAVATSLGCGNPTAVAALVEGETVLDLGSGAGIDVLLSARRVGPTGFAYGLDMTDEMLELARRHADEAGASNVEFLKGYIEDIPLGPDAVDVVISNCVINLSPEKHRVYAEAYRVLKPGGRLIHIAPPPEDFTPQRDDVTVTRPHVGRDRAHLERILELVAEGAVKPPEIQTLPLAEAARAHELSQAGHVRGKIVFEVR